MKFSYFRALSEDFDTFIRKVQEIIRDLLLALPSISMKQ